MYEILRQKTERLFFRQVINTGKVGISGDNSIRLIDERRKSIG